METNNKYRCVYCGGIYDRNIKKSKRYTIVGATGTYCKDCIDFCEKVRKMSVSYLITIVLMILVIPSVIAITICLFYNPPTFVQPIAIAGWVLSLIIIYRWVKLRHVLMKNKNELNELYHSKMEWEN